MIVTKLETKRLILDQGSFEDYKKVYEFNFSKLRNICGEFVFERYDNDDEIRLMSKLNNNENEYDYIIFLKDGLIPIGNIMADRWIKSLNSIELSFNLHPNYWGYEYMKEAVLALIEYLFSIRYDNIIYRYSEDNDKSKRLSEKLGFTFFEKEENAWVKDGMPIADYKLILSKKDYEKNTQ